MKLPVTLYMASIFCALTQISKAQDIIDLSGTWSFQLDETHVGEQERWFEQDLDDEILLPGSTDERGFGVKALETQPARLTREFRHVGAAWYQKTISIPEAWQGRHVELFLERAMWETKVWLDDHYIGMQDSLCVPHRFDLSDYLTPGEHRLTVRIDNRFKFNVGHEQHSNPSGWTRMWAMSVTEESQTNWNGIIGRMQLRAMDPVWIERVEAHPNTDKRETKIIAYVRSRVGSVSGEITVSASSGDHRMAPNSAKFRTKNDDELSSVDTLSPRLSDLSGPYYRRRSTTSVEIILPFGEGAKLWDEFSPNIYQLKAELKGEGANGASFSHAYPDTFGLRKFEADGKKLMLNGRRVFLRANQDNCIHPKTGYPPMDKAAWLAFLQLHKDYGLNSMRFHSWCPPKAAFEAADELGMLIHVETPLWDGPGEVGDLPDRATYIRHEADRILTAYGNHPSFCMMAIGNELGKGKELYLQYLVEVLRKRDTRHLYSPTAGVHLTYPDRNDDFIISAGGVPSLNEPAQDQPLRFTARGFLAGDQPDSDLFNTDTDYVSIRGFEKPFVAHEIGQHTSFPDFYSWFNEEKYTGPLKAGYVGLIKERFEQFHPAARGPKFAKASGALQLLLYKAEIETMLRTPDMDGFHLNGIMDYPGEGIALIGMLDAMGDSKGIVSPEDFRRFCSDTVPLARFKKWNWIVGDRFEATAQVRHHGPYDLTGSRWIWSIMDKRGKTVLKGDLGIHDAATGELTDLGKISAKLPHMQKPQELILEMGRAGSAIANSWRFWVYPEAGTAETPKDVLIAQSWTPDVKKALESGGRVLLTPSRESTREFVDIRFWSVFWGRGLFPDLDRPMGIYCDPKHPALDQFPTREHSDWQWYDMLTGAFALNLNELPFGFEPVVHVIDDFNLSHRLGVVLEAKVGQGSLMISTLNLGREGQRSLPQRNMLKSLLTRVIADDFKPAHQLSTEQLESLFH